MNLRNIIIAIALLTTVPAAVGQSDDGMRAGGADWMSYRDAYKSMLWFEKYGKPKHLIQLQLQVIPKDRAITADNLRLHIFGKFTHIDLKLDELGRTVLPLLKSAYDDNAELVVNQKTGQTAFRFRTTISPRTDGIYELADLRAGCEQVLAYQSYIDASANRGKRCVGVRFVFSKKDNGAIVEFKYLSQNSTLPILDNATAWPESAPVFKISDVIFGAQSNVATHTLTTPQIEKGQIHTRTSPLAIIALIE